MDFNYYSFILYGKERIYYTYENHDTEQEILDWAVRFHFIQESDIQYCTNIRAMSCTEVKERNKALYNKWWEKHKYDVSLGGRTPPTIGEVQLN